jgi:hypothetical protein
MLALAHIEVNGKWTHPAWAFMMKGIYWVKQKMGRISHPHGSA